MAAIIWVLLPVLIAAGSALLAFYVMQARMEVALAREREALSEARGRLESQQKAMEQTIRATEEATRRKALDEFFADLRVEERHFLRESKMLFLNRKSLVLQERVFFRNIPLSNWVERETVVHDGADLDELVKSLSIFGGEMLTSADGRAKRKLLR